ncbi:hypothetical protein DERF_005976 [Dermatophagoides farinae]|uniref:Uncharacterized protein n=1 Tax=Dermatophagoides farinae TaxID=6954 RepID=A0A922L7P8_DERFA|nr:hypothetical protein DERF_005976 [Dermatophagoides farinae]
MSDPRYVYQSKSILIVHHHHHYYADVIPFLSHIIMLSPSVLIKKKIMRLIPDNRIMNLNNNRRKTR